MPPKKNTEKEASETGDMQMQDLFSLMKSMSVKLNNVESKMVTVEAFDSEVKTLRVLLEDLKSENIQIKKELKDKDKQLADMQDQLNRQEIRLNHVDQHHRGWSARVMNIPLSDEEEYNNEIVMKKVYELALLPILKGALEAGMLTSIPKVHELLETAHVLPGNNTKPGQCKPVIFRFFTRNMKTLCFRLKKEYAARSQASSGTRREEGAVGGGSGVGEGGRRSQERGGYLGKGKYSYPFYEDLTKANFALMRNIANDPRVQACWSNNSNILFKLQDSNIVEKVGSILEPLDSILKK